MATVVVTGATSGVGLELATRLAAGGRTVVPVGRNAERAAAACRAIEARVPGADLRPAAADLARLAEVRALAERLGRNGMPDVVVSNAAVIARLDDVTESGLHRTLVVNHLAPYLLLRLLASSPERPARFVVVGADPDLLRRVPVDLDDLNARDRRALGRIPSVRPFLAYGRTKNMNAMFVRAFARRVPGSTVNGAHPGIVDGTGLGRGTVHGTLRVLAPVLGAVRGTVDVAAGADTPAWLATAPELDGVTGRFFVRRTEVATAPHTTDEARCDRLWDLSARLVGLDPEL